ncbi:MAG: G8 domain-containing protein [Pseudomonadota bacterium]
MALNLGTCPLTGESICFCGLDEDDPSREPVNEIFEADDQQGTLTGYRFEYTVEGLTSTAGNDGFLLSDGNSDEVTFAGGDDVIVDFTLGEDALTIDIPGLELANSEVSTAPDFLALVAAAAQVDVDGSQGAPTVEAYICEHADAGADLILIVRNEAGEAEHSVKLVGLADEIGAEALEEAGAIVEEHDASEHDHGDGPMVIENNNAFLMAMGEGSRIEIHAVDAAKESWTQLTETAMAGDTSLNFSEATQWEVGDVIAIAPSGRDWQEDEVRIITAVSNGGRTVTIDEPLEFNHYGEIETYTNGVDSWDIDMRAEVALLSRNITIQGDEDSVDDGFGAHTMIMHGAEQHISGAEFTRVGQEDILGRYPIHWHMLGEGGTGQYVQNVSIHQSFQKGSTIHGTSNVLYKENVIFDHVGHGVFFEDGSETGNVIENNLVFGTKASESGLPIPTDRDQVSSYWIENASNTFIGNHAAGGEHTGFFLAPAKNGPHGLSAEVFPDAENDLYDMVFEGNTAHSYRRDGLFADGFIDHETLEWQVSQIGDGKFMMEDYTAYSNNRFGFWFRGGEPIVENAKLADNRNGSEFHTSEGILSNSIVVGDSNNVADVTGNLGIRLYRTADTGFDNVHFENIAGDAISQLEGDVVNETSWLNDLTFTNVGDVFGWRQNDRIVNNQYEQRFIDLDGSVTGTPGTWITQRHLDEAVPNTAGPGAAVGSDALGEVWLNEAGSVASTEIRINHPNTLQADLTVTRWDGLQFVLTDGRVAGDRDQKQFLTHTPTDREAAYLIEFDVFPTDFRLQVDGLRVGEAVVYQFQNVADFDMQNGFTIPEVTSLNELFASNSSAALVKDGNLIVRIVGVAPDPAEESFSQLQSANNPGASLLGDEGAEGDGLRFINLIQDATPTSFGNASFDTGLLNALSNTSGPPPIDVSELVLPDGPTPHATHASTSETETVTDGIPRWSDNEVWGGSEPGANDIIVIGEGQTVVLDQSATVRGIIVDGGSLIVEDAPGGPANEIMLISDYVLVINGGLFQAGTEVDPLDRDFTLELTGDDPDFDLEVTRILNGQIANTVFAQAEQEVPVTLVEGTADPSNAAPVANDDRFDVSGSTTTVLDVTANDTDKEMARADLTITEVSDPDAGSVEIIDDTIHFTPDYEAYRTESGLLDPNAEETFAYQIADDAGNTAEASVTVALTFEPGSVTGWLFVDEDQNGAFSRDEDTGVAGYEVHLFFNGSIVAKTTTLAGGFYRLDDVPAGDGYSVRFITQDGSEFVPTEGQFVGSADNLNSSKFEVPPGATVRQVNGVVQPTLEEQPPTGRLELGSLDIKQEASHLWTRVDFETEIPNAVVVVGPLTSNGPHEAMVRVRNVDETGFELQIDEWSYLDGWHTQETVSWIAATQGTHKLPDGTVIQAGRTVAENESKTKVAFEDTFEDTPILFTQVASYNGSDPVVTRNVDVTTDGFAVKMQEEEAKPNHHFEEQIDWIAIEKSDGILETGTETINHKFKALDIEADQIFLADLQTINGGNTANLRYIETGDGGISIRIDEETSRDEEKWHRFEEIAFVTASEGSHSLSSFDTV